MLSQPRLDISEFTILLRKYFSSNAVYFLIDPAIRWQHMGLRFQSEEIMKISSPVCQPPVLIVLGGVTINTKYYIILSGGMVSPW